MYFQSVYMCVIYECFFTENLLLAIASRKERISKSGMNGDTRCLFFFQTEMFCSEYVLFLD